MTDRILVVEDDPAILRGLSDNVRAEGYGVLVASDGEAAYRLIRDQQPDLILLDVMLPGVNGVELCRRVRSEGMHTPIIMLTAHGAEDERVHGLDAGANDYVTKPFLLSELLARIRGMLRHRRDWSSDHERLERDLRTAADVQQRLLPQSKPASSTIDCAGVCHPALGIGGDYFDFLELEDGLLGLVLADVAGKGIPAALSMASIHGIIRAEAPRFGNRCAELIATVNAALCATMEPGRYATLFYGLYDEAARTLTYVNAGHPPPLLIRANPARADVLLDANVPPVGLFPTCAPTAETTRLDAGDWLIAFSDGISESAGAGGAEFGRDRIAHVVRMHRHLGADTMRDALIAAVRDHAAGHPQCDDMTVIVGKGI